MHDASSGVCPPPWYAGLGRSHSLAALCNNLRCLFLTFFGLCMLVCVYLHMNVCRCVRAGVCVTKGTIYLQCERLYRGIFQRGLASWVVVFLIDQLID